MKILQFLIILAFNFCAVLSQSDDAAANAAQVGGPSDSASKTVELAQTLIFTDTPSPTPEASLTPTPTLTSTSLPTLLPTPGFDKSKILSDKDPKSGYNCPDGKDCKEGWSMSFRIFTTLIVFGVFGFFIVRWRRKRQATQGFELLPRRFGEGDQY